MEDMNYIRISANCSNPPTNIHASLYGKWNTKPVKWKDWEVRSILFSHLLLMHLVIKPIQTDISRLPFPIKETAHAHRPDILWIWQKNGILCIPIINMKYENLMMLSTLIHALATVISS